MRLDENIPEMSEGIQVRSSTCCHEESAEGQICHSPKRGWASGGQGPDHMELEGHLKDADCILSTTGNYQRISNRIVLVSFRF